MTEATIGIQQDHAPAEAEDRTSDAEAPEAPDDAAEAGSEKLVPVGESIRYRRRAQAAEQKLHALQQHFDELQQDLARTRGDLESVERRQRIDQLLIESEAIDLEAARLLTESALEQMDDADVAEAVEELRSRKPYLFRRRGSALGGGMSPRPRHGNGQLDDAASCAATSGDRRDLLRYLRLRRKR